MFNLFNLFKKRSTNIYITISNESENFLSLDFNRNMNLDNFQELLKLGLTPSLGGEYDLNGNFFVVLKKLHNYDESKLQDLLIKWVDNG